MSLINRKSWINWYKNILFYLKGRNEAPCVELTDSELISNMINNNFIKIRSKNICVILTVPGQRYSLINNDTKRKINDLLNHADFKEILYICDIILVGEKSINIVANIKKMILDFNSVNPDVWVQIRPYTVFVLNILNSKEIVEHKRIDQDKILSELDERRINITSIPRIREWDPPIVWIGARKGEIVEINRISGSVGQQTILRRVVN